VLFSFSLFSLAFPRSRAGLKTGHYKELPGCAADGNTYKEALANVEIIIQEWIETAKELGRPIPAPRGRLAFA
jgi:predicted RNase H-like HicB family nuclease